MTATVEAVPRVLVVEDEQVLAMDMEMQLLALGYDVTGIASTGKEALRLAQTTAPNLILMDIQLQGAIDGIATAEAIQRESHTPVVFVTAHGTSEAQSRAHATSAAGYLTKPYRPEELRAVIATALQQNKPALEPSKPHG